MVKRSPYYRRLYSELQAPFPADAWHDDQWAFFVFDLRGEGSVNGLSKIAIFAVNLQERTLEKVKLVTVDAYRKEASVEDLRGSDERYIVPMPRGW